MSALYKHGPIGLKLEGLKKNKKKLERQIRTMQSAMEQKVIGMKIIESKHG